MWSFNTTLNIIKKYSIIGMSVVIVTGCSTQQTANTSAKPKNSEPTKTTAATTTISNPKVTMQGRTIAVTIFISNATAKAVSLQPSEFALISGTHVLSPVESI